MATEFKYLTKEEIFELHNQIIEEIGGTHGLREEGGIDQLTDFVENDWYYPTLEDNTLSSASVQGIILLMETSAYPSLLVLTS